MMTHTSAAAEHVRLPLSPAVTPRLVAHGPDERLNQQAGDRASDVEDRQVVRVSTQQKEQRVHRRLSHSEAVLNAEEPEVHPGDVAERHQGTA